MGQKWRARKRGVSAKSKWNVVKRTLKRVSKEAPKVIGRAADTAEVIGDAVNESVEAVDAVVEAADAAKKTDSLADVMEAVVEVKEAVEASLEAVEASKEAVEASKDLASYTRDQLRKMAKKRKVPRYSAMNKKQLLAALSG